RALWRVDGLDAVPGAERAAPDTLLQRVLHDEPVEYGKAARRSWQRLLLRVAARSDPEPEQRRTARRVFRSNRVRHSGAGKTRHRREGKPDRPWNMGCELRVLQGCR